jgi:peroxiredoxin
MKAFILIAFLLSAVGVHAQGSLIQNAIEKLEGYKNFSYQYVYKQLEYTSDTTIMEHKDIFSKASEDTTFGYLFSMETLIKGNKFSYTDLYDGQRLMQINPEDSTYVTEKIQPFTIQGSLLGYLKVLEGLFEKRPSKIDPDTTIDGTVCTHLIINTYDTTIHKEHYYTRIHVYIDKVSGLPNRIMARSRNTRVGNGITNYYGEYRYSKYLFDQDNIDAAAFTFAKGFHPPKERPALPGLLASGTVAPDWALYTEDGKKMSLAQMKGKVILLDFFFIGCEGCMLSLNPLNKLHKKYSNVAMISMTFRDSRQSVIAFKKNYHIQYPIYLHAGEVVKSYNVRQFPTFYFIDKEGKVANVVVGYNENFEERVTSILDDLLHK